MPATSSSHLKRISHNALALTGLQVANLLLPLITLPYLLRVLGPEQFGAYGLAQAVVTQCVVLADFGFNLSATQRLAQLQGQQQAISRLFWSVQTAKALLALGALVLLALATLLVPRLAAIAPVVLGSAPALVAAVIFPQWLFQGLERMAFITLSSVLARAATIPLVFACVRTPQDAWLAAAIAALAPLLAGLLACGLIAWHGLIGWSQPRRADLAEVLRADWPMFTSTAATSLYSTITPVLLGLLTTTHAVGLYSAADRIRQACQSLITPLGQAAFPRINAVMADDRGAGLALVRRLLLLQGGVTLLMSAALWSLAPQIVALVMGPAFGEAVPVLRLLAALPLLIGLSNVLGIQAMLPLGMNTAFSRIVLASAMGNLLLLAALAPPWQARGAATAVLLTECLVTTAMAWVLHRAGIRLLSSTGKIAHPT